MILFNVAGAFLFSPSLGRHVGVGDTIWVNGKEALIAKVLADYPNPFSGPVVSYFVAAESGVDGPIAFVLSVELPAESIPQPPDMMKKAYPDG